MQDRTCSVEGCETKAHGRGWCQAHLLRWKKTGDVQAHIPMKHKNNHPCLVDECDAQAVSRGWCDRHWSRWRKWGDPLGEAPAKPTSCSIEGCSRKPMARGWCNTHYGRWRKHGDPMILKQAEDGKGSINNNGYRIVTVSRGRKMLEHRYVMEQAIGRPLLPMENVHHVNGDRLDNRVENLELWASSQPSGQRVEDLVAHAKALLALYRPEALASH
jgi:hypothetical protein